MTEGRFCTLLSVLRTAAFNSEMLPGRNAGRRDIGQPRTGRQRDSQAHDCGDYPAAVMAD
ncbi:MULTISPECIES: hypothetical protein [unclassified Caballeronia]|uniref:hypothetical protein n=1 Tax=unclassified Caballeronia TaxID=2646786 RepID=UPI0013ED724D|nr:MULTISPECIES: hypothetical protein [unclassified Caballeronia]